MPTHRRTRGRALAAALVLAGAAALALPRAGDARAARPARPAQPARAAQPRTGQQIFASTCAACHQAQGEGTNVYPPLAGSEYVTGPDTRLARIILHGLVGDIEVQGQQFAGAMPAWGPSLTDAEIAAVATYIRASWGNQAPAVTPATVAQVRAAFAARKTPWTAPELAQAIPVEKH